VLGERLHLIELVRLVPHHLAPGLTKESKEQTLPLFVVYLVREIVFRQQTLELISLLFEVALVVPEILHHLTYVRAPAYRLYVSTHLIHLLHVLHLLFWVFLLDKVPYLLEFLDLLLDLLFELFFLRGGRRILELALCLE
jgi:hypothetical protein